MTISVSQNLVIALGNAVDTAFSFNFVGVSASDISVTFVDTDNSQTTLTASQYTLTLNAAAVGQIWGVGGTVTYPIVGSPIASGTSLIIQRILPLTQTTSISNQGDFSPQVIEAALDTLCMEIQQVSGRTGQFRGVWVTGANYNVGDIVQDGANGNGSGSYYMCIVANTSGTWSTDLAAGDWTLVLPASSPTLTLPVAIAQGGTGATSLSTASTNGFVTTSSVNTVTNAMQAQIPANSVKANNTAATANVTSVSINLSSVLGRGSSGNIVALSNGYGATFTASSVAVFLTSATNSVSVNVTMNATATYFDGPSINVGSSGTWYVSGTVTIIEQSANSTFKVKLWDGTTVIDSAQLFQTSNQVTAVSLSGVITSPAGNIKISVLDGGGTTGLILANNTGNAKDSTVTAIRIG